MRGAIHPIGVASRTPVARKTLLADLDLPVVSAEDIYGGIAGRGHGPSSTRDLFDVMQLFALEDITPAIRQAFVVYLANHMPSYRFITKV